MFSIIYSLLIYCAQFFSPPPQVESAFQEAAQFALAQENTDADYIPETINLNTPQPTTAGKKGCC